MQVQRAIGQLVKIIAAALDRRPRINRASRPTGGRKAKRRVRTPLLYTP